MIKSKKLLYILLFFGCALLRFIFKYFIYEGSFIKELLISFGYLIFFSFLALVNYFCNRYNFKNSIFRCPKCGGKVVNEVCTSCKYSIKKVNGVYYTNDDNISKECENKYIGYDNINLNFSPDLIYKGINNYGVFYSEPPKDIVKRLGKRIAVLDLGCGLGSAAISFAKAGVKVIGADISKEMLEFAYKRDGGDLSHLYLCKMDAYNLMLEDESIDVVVENSMIHLVDNPEKVFQEIYRVLKPNGWFVLFNTKSIEITKEQKELSKKCYDAFKDIKSFYFEKLKEEGYEPEDFDNDHLNVQGKYFYTINDNSYHPVLDKSEVFTDYMKYGVHRLEHKAHFFLQHISDDIHKKVWKKVDGFARGKYGDDYKEIKNYFHYKAGYDIYLKKDLGDIINEDKR